MTVAKRLKELCVKEVSLVPKGANNKRIFLTKAAEPEAVVEDKVETPAEDVVRAAEAQLEELKKAAEEQKGQLEELRKAAAEATSKQIELQKALDAEREASDVREAVLKHAEEFKHLPGKAEDVAPALRALSKAAPEAATVLKGVLKQVEALLSQGASLEPVGKATEPVAVSKADVLGQKVEELRKADPKLSLDQAVSRVLEAHPELYGVD